MSPFLFLLPLDWKFLYIFHRKRQGEREACILTQQQTVTLAPSPFLRPAQAGVAAVALWWCQDLWVRPFSCGGAGMETSSVSTVTAGGSMASQPPSAGGDNARAPCPEVSLCVLFSISPSVCPNPWLFWPHSVVVVVVVASINL